jgi:hypothetical protein
VIDARVARAPAPFAVVLDRVRRHAWIGAWWLGGRGLVLVASLASRRGIDALGMWDGRWYRTVARDGYLLVPGRQSDPAFFPLFPVLLRGGHALGLGYTAAAVAIANGAFLVALLAFHALTEELFGDSLARRATVYLAIFPFGYVFSMAYPESLVLAAIALACLAAIRGRWPAAAMCAAAAALARPEALFLALPLAALGWRQRSRLSPGGRAVALGAALAPLAAAAAFPLYLDRVLHDPLAWTRAERAWGRHFSVLGALRAVEHLGDAFAGNAWVVRDVVATVLYVALLVAAARAGTPRSWLLAGSAVVLLPLFSGAFSSIGRFGLLAPPVIWGLAWVGRRRRVDLAVRGLSLALLVAATVTIPLAFP